MSHEGPLTLARKKMLAMQAAHPPPIFVPTLVTFGDVEMHDVSAPASVATSPPPNYSHSCPQTVFSAAAKPFVPPGAAANPTTVVWPAPVTTPAAITMSAPIPTPRKVLPPHRALQVKDPNTISSAKSSPSIKPEPPASPVLTASIAVPSPIRRPGPHSKLGPHVRKQEVSAQPKAPSTIQNDLVDIQQTKSDPDPWVGVSDAQMTTDTWGDVHQPNIKTEPAESESLPVSNPVSTTQDVWDDLGQLKSEPNGLNGHRKTQVKAEVEAVPVVDQSDALDSAPSAAALQLSGEPTTASDQMSSTTRRFGRNEWLSMLLDMKDTEKGRQLIAAFGDHIRASVESKQMSAAGDIELLTEFPGGQYVPATVTRETTVSELIKECASLTRTNESDIRIVLKIGVKDDGQSQEEL